MLLVSCRRKNRISNMRRTLNRKKGVAMRIPSADVSIDLGEASKVKAGNSPGGAHAAELGSSDDPQVVAEAMFKLAFALLAGDVRIDMKVAGKILQRDPKYKFPKNPNP